MPLSFSGFTTQTIGLRELVGRMPRVMLAVADQARSAFITTPFALAPNTDLAAAFEFASGVDPSAISL
jgi:hypothetical protein